MVSSDNNAAGMLSREGPTKHGEAGGKNSKPRAASTERSTARPGRRKKASRACFHCQKAHLTCDDLRPCQRCIRKGLADQCVDGYRKKAKYLLEEDDISSTVQQPTLHMEAPPSGPDLFLNNLHENMAIPEASSFSPTVFKQTSKEFGCSEPSAAFAFDPKTAFGFDPTSLECSILTSMLHDADSSVLSGDSPDVAHIPAMDLMESYTTLQSSVPGGTADDGTNVPPVASWNTQPHMQPMSDRRDSTGSFTKQGMYMGSLGQQMKQNSRNSPSSLDTNVVFSPEALVQAGKSTAQRACADEKNPSHEHSQAPSNNNESMWNQRVSRVYNDQVKPFRYTEAYHILLKYVMQKYDKADVLRIVRALAIFRPSLIALQMPLSVEDEVFVERAFQRTILEFEKLISFSGTPTVVWRRTCEISLVGSEFCMLTQWSKEDLMGKYIYQFMDKSSVLKYWELFASHAFENTTPSVMTTCVLLSPSGRPIPCTWCFTIKRDPFDLPGYVVGNFLPILS